MPEWSDDKLLTAREFADYLGVKGTPFKEARRRGEIPEPIHIGTSPRWRWGDVKEWARAMAIVKRMTPGVFGRNRTESDDFGPSETEGGKASGGKPKRD